LVCQDDFAFISKTYLSQFQDTTQKLICSC